METRKVQISGGSTFIISLPKRWAERNGLSSGSPLNIMEDRSGNLIMSPGELNHRGSIVREIRLSGKEGPDALMRRLVGAYVSGMNNIIVSSKGAITPPLARTVREFTRLVMGVEILEEKKDLIKLQDLIDPVDFSIRSGLKRMTFITEKMVDDVLNGIGDLNGDFFEDVIVRDIEVDRINWLIHKDYNILNRSPKISERTNISFEDSLNFMLTSRIVERVADHAVSMARHLMGLSEIGDPSILPPLVKQGKVARDIFSDSVRSLFSRDMQLADSVVDRSRALKVELEPMLKKVFLLPADEAVLLAYVINSLDRIASYGGDIGKITLNSFAPSKDEH